MEKMAAARVKEKRMLSVLCSRHLFTQRASVQAQQETRDFRILRRASEDDAIDDDDEMSRYFSLKYLANFLDAATASILLPQRTAPQ